MQRRKGDSKTSSAESKTGKKNAFALIGVNIGMYMKKIMSYFIMI